MSGWLFGFINRLNDARLGNPSFILYILHATFLPLMGFWNFLVLVTKWAIF